MIVIIGLILPVDSSVQSQEDIAQCLPEIYWPALRVPGALDSPIWLDMSDWDAMHQLSGEDESEHYMATGFVDLVPIDPYFRLDALNVVGLSPVMVWVWYSEITPNVWYWFIFGDARYGDDGNPHPCGVYAVSYADSLNWLIKALTNAFDDR
jgi:hypothetical protein